jgi:hypothetical protein
LELALRWVLPKNVRAFSDSARALAQSALEKALKFMQNQSAVDSGRDLFANQQTRNNFCCLVFLTSYKIDKDFQQPARCKSGSSTTAQRNLAFFAHFPAAHTSSAYILDGTYLYIRVYIQTCVFTCGISIPAVCLCIWLSSRLYNPPAFFIIYLGFSLSSLKYDVL